MLAPDLLGSIRLRGNYQGMLLCTKLLYVTNVELIIMSNPRGPQPQKGLPRKFGPHARYLAPRHQRQQQRFVPVKQVWLPKKKKSQHHKEKPQTPKKDPSYEELPIAGSFMRSLIRYMELQSKDGGQNKDTHFPRGSRPT
jgi:hypothetical protein